MIASLLAISMVHPLLDNFLNKTEICPLVFGLQVKKKAITVGKDMCRKLKALELLQAERYLIKGLRYFKIN